MKKQAGQIVLKPGRSYVALMKQLEKLHGPVRMLDPAFKQALNESRALKVALAWHPEDY